MVRDLLKRGVTIKTINQTMTFKPFTGNPMEDMVVKTQLLMITAMAEAERMNRLQSAEDGRKAMRNGALSKSGKHGRKLSKAVSQTSKNIGVS